MLDLRMEVNGIVQIDRRLSRLTSNIDDLGPAFDDIRNAFIRYQRQEFETEGRHGGYAWQKLSEKYRAWKAKHAPGKRILDLTGDLRKSLTSRLHHVSLPTKLVMWSDSDVGGYHQDGDGPLPARKIVATPEEEKRDWQRFLQRHLMKGVNR